MCTGDSQQSRNPAPLKQKPPWCCSRSLHQHLSGFIMGARALGCPELFFLKLVPFPGIFIAFLESSRTILTNPSASERRRCVAFPCYMKRNARVGNWRIKWVELWEASCRYQDQIPGAFVSSEPSCISFPRRLGC